MARALKFVKLNTSIKGLVGRAIQEFNHYLTEPTETYQWVCLADPETIAKALEVLADDLPEDDIARVATNMPYLMFLFHRQDHSIQIPVDATLAFLSILNGSDMVTLLRQCSDRNRLAPQFDLNPSQWNPIFFLLAGVPDLDHPKSLVADELCKFYLPEFVH
jgi:hypothetical protein